MSDSPSTFGQILSCIVGGGKQALPLPPVLQCKKSNCVFSGAKIKARAQSFCFILKLSFQSPHGQQAQVVARLGHMFLGERTGKNRLVQVTQGRQTKGLCRGNSSPVFLLNK